MVPSSTTTTFQEDDNMALLSSLLNSGYCTSEPQPAAEDGGQKVVKKRRRRKSRKEGEEAKKRRLSDEQVKFLETSFERERKLESGRKVRLASEAGLEPKQVAVWFQNRRARWKGKQLEGEYNKLKVELQEAVVEKCHLEAEMLKLKDQLAEAKTKITKLSGGGGSWERSSSPSTSLSVDTTHCQPFIGEEHLSYLHEYNYVNMLADWVDFYGM